MSSPPTFQVARRPGLCTLGSNFEVIANTFEVLSFPKEPFLHYDVIEPAARNPRHAGEIFHRLQIHTAPNIFSRAVAAFDGVRNIYVLKGPLFSEGAMTFTVNMSDRPPVDPNPRGVHHVTMKKVADIVPGDLTRVLEGHDAGMPMMTTPLQVLNVLAQQAASLKFPVHTKQKYYEDTGHSSFGGFEIWRGFFASVRPSLKRLILNVDMATGVMYQRGPLIDFILAFFGIRDYRLLNELNEGHREWSRVKSVLKKLQIIQQPSNRLRTIKTITPRAGEYEFRLHDGQLATVADFFRNTHGINLRYPHMPGIVTHRKEVIPFELCKIKEGQLFKKKTSPELMSHMLNFSKKRPNERIAIVQRGMELMQLADSPYIQQAGLRIASRPMEIRGKLLEPPAMVYGQGFTQKPRNGTWNMVGRRLVEPMPIKSWAVVSFERIAIEEIQAFISALGVAMEAVGMSLNTKQPPIRFASPHQAQAELKSLCSEAQKATKELPTMLIIILPQNAAALRKSVKQFGDILLGVVTQCVRLDKMLKANNQYHNNLILKINAKLGGTNTVPSSVSQSFKWFSDGKTMVIGADVSHPGPGVLRPSVAALVASIDEGAAKYISKCAVQGPRSEIIEDLENLTSYALSMFYKYRRYLAKTLGSKNVPLLPERIVFYRDGVSEGEIQKVVEDEIRQIMNAIENFYAAQKVPIRAKLTFIVVGKRHHIRFIPKQGQGADKSGNAPAGLLVDQEVTAPGIFDFYLLSHAGLLGTSRPSHYIVVKDDNSFDANTLQGFSFALCHTYARATRSVSIPAPCYYADIACARADYHFPSSLNYDDDLSSTEGQFDLTPWLKGFSNVHERQATKMYFM